MSFEGQNARAKIRLELENGILLEVPLKLIAEAMRKAYLKDKRIAQWAFFANGEATHLSVSDFRAVPSIPSEEP